jgi:hypothetical protein
VTLLSRAGLSVEVPTGWEGELIDHPGHRVVLHLSSGPLPAKRSDFGGEALERLRDRAIFVSLLEYDPSEANVGLFKRRGFPLFVPSDFAPNRLHRQIRGQTGAQKFFTYRNRTFCCYAVIARETATTADTARVNNALRGLSVAIGS